MEVEAFGVNRMAAGRTRHRAGWNCHRLFQERFARGSSFVTAPVPAFSAFGSFSPLRVHRAMIWIQSSELTYHRRLVNAIRPKFGVNGLRKRRFSKPDDLGAPDAKPAGQLV